MNRGVTGTNVPPMMPYDSKSIAELSANELSSRPAESNVLAQVSRIRNPSKSLIMPTNRPVGMQILHD